MIPLALGKVRELCAGDLRVAAGAEEVTGVRIDSRRVVTGDLFVAIPPNFSSAPVTHTLRVVARDYDLAETSRIAGTVVVAVSS